MFMNFIKQKSSVSLRKFIPRIFVSVVKKQLLPDFDVAISNKNDHSFDVGVLRMREVTQMQICKFQVASFVG